MGGLTKTCGRAAILAAGLAGCGGPPDLVTLRSSQAGPDEFSVLPSKPLETPPDLVALPVPTPGGANRTDPTPEADAIAALGGAPAAIGGDGVRGAGLIAHVRRFGVDGDIRRTLAAEDLAFRDARQGLLLERTFGTNTYFRAYAGQSLDPYSELERFRAAGVRTPAAPPEGD